MKCIKAFHRACLDQHRDWVFVYLPQLFKFNSLVRIGWQIWLANITVAAEANAEISPDWIEAPNDVVTSVLGIVLPHAGIENQLGSQCGIFVLQFFNTPLYSFCQINFPSPLCSYATFVRAQSCRNAFPPAARSPLWGCLDAPLSASWSSLTSSSSGLCPFRARGFWGNGLPGFGWKDLRGFSFSILCGWCFTFSTEIKKTSKPSSPTAFSE